MADSIGWSGVATVLPRGFAMGWRASSVWGIDPLCRKYYTLLVLLWVTSSSCCVVCGGVCTHYGCSRTEWVLQKHQVSILSADHRVRMCSLLDWCSTSIKALILVHYPMLSTVYHCVSCNYSDECTLYLFMACDVCSKTVWPLPLTCLVVLTNYLSCFKFDTTQPGCLTAKLQFMYYNITYNIWTSTQYNK